MGTLYGVLVDTISIQKYVFQSSRLKENIGASYIVSDVIKKLIRETKEGFTHKGGYEGGGNYLLFFTKEDEAALFVKKLTITALYKAPGLKIITACDKYEFDSKYDEDEKYFDFKEKLFKKLSENKRKILPKVTLDSHGINEDCPRTGLSAEVWLKENKFSNYVSSVSAAKLSCADEANANLENSFGNKYKFPSEFEDLGHTKHEDSHLAVVHIDGNGFGELFKKIKTLKETDELSKKLEEAVKSTFESLLDYIMDKWDIINDFLDLKDSKMIPIRPIILGGDDITFVCDGRMGIHFAEKFIEFFGNQPVAKNNLTMCAGIAIVKLKFPFYRAYLLAEDLCSNAKIKRHNSGDAGSWIDYHISYSSFSDSIEQIREKEFKNVDIVHTMKPYSLDSKEPKFSEIVDAASKFTAPKDEKPQFPRNKLKHLREFIVEGGRRADYENQYPDLKIPYINNLNNNFDDGKATPYLDAIELTELYPFILTEKPGKEKK